MSLFRVENERPSSKYENLPTLLSSSFILFILKNNPPVDYLVGVLPGSVWDLYVPCPDVTTEDIWVT